MLVAVWQLWFAGTNVTWLARNGNISIYMHLRMRFLLTTRLVSAQDSRLLGQTSNLSSSIIQNDQSFFLVKLVTSCRVALFLARGPSLHESRTTSLCD